MALAAKEVSAIPKLLEHVLLHVDGQGLYVYTLQEIADMLDNISQLTGVATEDIILAASGERDHHVGTESVRPSASQESMLSNESERDHDFAGKGHCGVHTALRGSCMPTTSMKKMDNNAPSVQCRSKLVGADLGKVCHDARDSAEEPGVSGDHHCDIFVSSTKDQDTLNTGSKLKTQHSLRKAGIGPGPDVSDIMLYGLTLVGACVAVSIAWFLLRVLFSNWG